VLQASTEISELKDHWQAILPDENSPAVDQWAIWLAMHKPSVVSAALTQTAIKRKKVGNEMSGDRLIRFASAIMTRLSKEASAVRSIDSTGESTK
jgi:hypothetical protein